MMIEHYLPLELKEGTSFGCPVCGSYLAGVDNSDYCPHVLFIHDKQNNSFIYCNEFCVELVQESCESEDNSDNEILETLIGRLKATTTIFFEVTLSEQVLIIGIDLSM